MFNLAIPVLICDGEFKIVNITEDLYDKAEEVFLNYFVRYESACVVSNLFDSEESKHEMGLLLRAALADGISFAAIHVKTNELVALAVNKLLSSQTNCGVSEVCRQFHGPGMSSLADYLKRMEDSFDIFKEWNIDCTMDIAFLTTNTNFNGYGLATELSKHSIKFAQEMLKGSLKNYETLPIHLRNLKPQAVCSVFSSKYSQKIGERLGFETLAEISHKDFIFEGKTFYEKLDPIHTHSTFSALRL